MAFDRSHPTSSAPSASKFLEKPKVTELSAFGMVQSLLGVAKSQVRLSAMDPISKPKELARLKERAERHNARAEASAVLPDGALAELLYEPREGRTRFCVFAAGSVRYEMTLVIEGERIVPYAATNNLLRHGVVLLPSGAEEYGSEADLIGEIRTYLHRYVDLTPTFETIATYYVLLSWVYDAFNELPYLRVRGDPGSGKTRFLLTVGSLCYKPIFASGASTVSPLFRILDAFRGTLVIDESDFRLSDERAEVVKILNNGNAKGFPVLRSEAIRKGEYNPTAYAVFGPKLIATRGVFDDRALESRCITEALGQFRLREDIPINLPDTLADEALRLRNMLLLFRFRNRGKRRPAQDLVDPTIEPRLNQVFVPLLAVIEDSAARAELHDLARRLNHEMVTDRGMDMEAQVLEVIRDLLAAGDERLGIAEIAQRFADRFGGEYARTVTAKWIGTVVRRKLHLTPVKRDGVFVIPLSERLKLDRLYERYGLSPTGSEAEADGGCPPPGDMGDVGDVAGTAGPPAA